MKVIIVKKFQAGCVLCARPDESVRTGLLRGLVTKYGHDEHKPTSGTKFL